MLSEIYPFIEPHLLTIGWFGLAIYLLFMELFTPGLLYFVALAIGSLGGMVAAALEQPLIIQCVTMLALSIVAFIILSQLVKKNHLAKQQFSKTATNTDALIGQVAIVTKRISLHERGQVKIRGELWPAKTTENKSFAHNSEVTVVQIQGNTVFITNTKGE